MKNMQLLAYVKLGYLLESQRHALSKIIQVLKNEKRSIECSIVEPKLDDKYKPQEEKSALMWVAIALLGAFPVFFDSEARELLVSMISDRTLVDLIYAFSPLSGLVMMIGGVCGAFCTSDENKKAALANEKRLEQVKQNKKAYRQELENNKRKRKAIRKLESEIAFFEGKLQEKARALNMFYAHEVIHEDYRNLYSMSKFHKLLDTGICNSREGFEGLYSQIRFEEIIDNQHLLIGKVDESIRAIKSLEAAVKKANKLGGVVSDGYSAYHGYAKSLPGAPIDVHNNDQVRGFLSECNHTNDLARAYVASYPKLAG